MLLKDPSWNGLTPLLPGKKRTRAAAGEYLLKKLGVEGKVYSVSFGEKLTENYIIDSGIQQKFFVKAESNSYKDFFLATQGLMLELAKKKISVYPFQEFYEDKIKNKIYMLYPYVEGRRICATPNDISLLGRELANLHRVLGEKKEKWVSATINKYKNLEKIRGQLVGGKYKTTQYRITREVIALADRLNFEYFCNNGQALHGDLNPGNMVLSNEDRITFFDFEDTLHSVQPVITEIALILERIVFLHCNDQQKIDLGDILLKNYQQAGGSYVFCKQDYDVLSYLSLKAFCTILFAWEQDSNISVNEWEKFIFLLEMAQKNKNIIKKILDKAGL